ncbi:hypothetical protein [Citrobacter phage Tr1]|nr:hypothetical protein [Citrobacter phage Tr1]
MAFFATIFIIIWIAGSVIAFIVAASEAQKPVMALAFTAFIVSPVWMKVLEVFGFFNH